MVEGKGFHILCPMTLLGQILNSSFSYVNFKRWGNLSGEPIKNPTCDIWLHSPDSLAKKSWYQNIWPPQDIGLNDSYSFIFRMHMEETLLLK